MNFFCADLHLGHRRAAWFRGYAGIPGHLLRDKSEADQDEIFQHMKADVLEDAMKRHDEKILEAIAIKTSSADVIYFLGDVAFSSEALSSLKMASLAKKMLIMGNHDLLSPKEYDRVFFLRGGFLKFKDKFWLSHAPIHPDELRGFVNLHGHTHHVTFADPPGGYFNCSQEALSKYQAEHPHLVGSHDTILWSEDQIEYLLTAKKATSLWIP